MAVWLSDTDVAAIRNRVMILASIGEDIATHGLVAPGPEINDRIADHVTAIWLRIQLAGRLPATGTQHDKHE